MPNIPTTEHHTTVKLHDVVRLEGCRIVSGSMNVTRLRITISGGTFFVPGFDYPFPTNEGNAFDIEADLSTNLMRAGHASETIVLWSDRRCLDFEINNVDRTMTLTDNEGNILVLPNRPEVTPTVTTRRPTRKERSRRKP